MSHGKASHYGKTQCRLLEGDRLAIKGAVLVHPGSDIMNVAEGIAKAAGYGPNEILQIGFDTSPQIMTAFEKGYVHLTSDQQPFLQGYLPVLSLCQTAVLGTGAINQDTGAGFVDTNNYKAVKALADAGLR